MTAQIPTPPAPTAPTAVPWTPEMMPQQELQPRPCAAAPATCAAISAAYAATPCSAHGRPQAYAPQPHAQPVPVPVPQRPQAQAAQPANRSRACGSAQQLRSPRNMRLHRRPHLPRNPPRHPNMHLPSSLCITCSSPSHPKWDRLLLYLFKRRNSSNLHRSNPPRRTMLSPDTHRPRTCTPARCTQSQMQGAPQAPGHAAAAIKRPSQGRNAAC